MFHQMCICSGLYSPREHFHFNISPPVFFWTLWWCPSYRLSDLVVCATLFSFAFDVVNFDVVNGGLNTLSFWALLFWGAGFLILLCHLCVSILVLQAAAFTMLFVAAKKRKCASVLHKWHTVKKSQSLLWQRCPVPSSFLHYAWH